MKQAEFFTSIMKIVCSDFDVTEKEILGRGRNQHVSDARHIIAYLVYTNRKITLTHLGKLLNRHHSTILNSIYDVRDRKDLMDYARKISDEQCYDTDQLQMILCMNPSYPMGNIITYNA